ncbi:hypothetical protein KIW84_041565 [Lathyrus oleraceus]|uniref:Tf2-1-like SH3-like domain-containing protein n=1 Tax=Pisum sativum TaxID=3888 RepID=A0A9D5ARS1_PEA|nr:hypothetical protein KIW84_041565 [Pisum sativum]
MPTYLVGNENQSCCSSAYARQTTQTHPNRQTWSLNANHWAYISIRTKHTHTGTRRPLDGLTSASKHTTRTIKHNRITSKHTQKRKRLPGVVSHDHLPTYLVWNKDQGDVVPPKGGENLARNQGKTHYQGVVLEPSVVMHHCPTLRESFRQRSVGPEWRDPSTLKDSDSIVQQHKILGLCPNASTHSRVSRGTTHRIMGDRLHIPWLPPIALIKDFTCLGTILNNHKHRLLRRTSDICPANPKRGGQILRCYTIPEWKWDSISMDFVSGLPRTTKNFEAIWVIVDRLTKSAHFIPIRMDYPLERLAELYIEKITDGQTERTIQSLEDLLRACVLEKGGAWDCYLPLIEFTYNNSFHSSIGMALFEALYGRRCRTPLCWYESGESAVVGPEIVQQTTEKIKMIQEKMRIAQSRQKSYHDKRRKSLEFQEGDHVFLCVTPITGVGRALKSKKLTPRFIGPYQILERIGEVAYRIALPPSLAKLHEVFHVSQLRRYILDPSHVVQVDDVQVRDNLTVETSPMRIEDRELKQLRGKEIILVKVAWGGPAGGNVTWELESQMKESYPELFT